jgi:hypothetical protein
VGIAVQSGDRWFFQTGDAYFFHGEMDIHQPHCTPGLMMYQTMLEKDRKSRLWNQYRLRELKRNYSDQIEIFCAHDVHEFERLSGRSAEVPVDKIIPLNRARPENFFPGELK